MFAIMKRASEVAGYVVALYAVFAGIIIAFNGHIPPWATFADAQTLEQSLKSFEKSQDQNDKSLRSNIDLLTLERLRDDAKDATIKADAHPRDPTAQSDKWFATKKLEVFFKAHPNLADAMGR